MSLSLPFKIIICSEPNIIKYIRLELNSISYRYYTYYFIDLHLKIISWNKNIYVFIKKKVLPLKIINVF